MNQQPLTGGRQTHAASKTFEQRRAEGAFELPNLFGKGGLGDVFGLGRATEAACAGDSQKVAELPEIHRKRL